MRRPAALLAALGAVALLLLPAGAPAGAAPAPEPEAPVAVLVDRLDPRAPVDPDEEVRVVGRLVNRGDERVRQLQVRLLVGPVLQSRSALAAADDDPEPGDTRGTAVPPEREELAPGATTRFELRLRVRQLRLSQLGVYPLQVRVRGEVGDEGRMTPVGLASTYVPWFPDGAPAQTRVAFLWPLVDVPRRAPREVMADDVLATSLARGGRLWASLHGAANGARGGACDVRPRPLLPPFPTTTGPCRAEPVPVTWVVDPDLLFNVDAMTRQYSVLERGRSTRAGTGTEAARAWLGALRDALTRPGSDVVALPWADVDVVALTRPESRLKDDVAKASTSGRRLASALLRETPLTGVAWPPAGPLTPSALDALVADGARAVVLDSTALPPPAGASSRTPGSRTALTSETGSVHGLVLDEALSRLLAPETEGWQGARLAEQRWLVETAMIAAERPTEQRTIVVAPPRRGEVVAAVATEAVADVGRVPWLCPVALADVVAGSEACVGEVAAEREPEPRGTLEAPRDTTGELSPAYLARVAEVRSRSDQLVNDVLVRDQSGRAAETGARLQRARLRLESSAWRDDAAGARRMLGLVDEDVTSLRDQVTVVTGGRKTLTSRSGTLRLSVQNRLDQPVSVAVRLQAGNEARLRVTSAPLVTVAPRNSRQVDVQAEAATSGQFVVQVQLVDRDGRPFGPPQQLVVRSTRYGRVALAVTGIGAGVLLVAAGVRITRRALARNAA